MFSQKKLRHTILEYIPHNKKYFLRPTTMLLVVKWMAFEYITFVPDLSDWTETFANTGRGIKDRGPFSISVLQANVGRHRRWSHYGSWNTQPDRSGCDAAINMWEHRRPFVFYLDEWPNSRGGSFQRASSYPLANSSQLSIFAVSNYQTTYNCVQFKNRDI